MNRFLKSILGIAILAWLVLYLVNHADQLKALKQFSGIQFAMLQFLWFLLLSSHALVVQSLLRPHQIKADVLDMVNLNNAALLLNYAPMKFGTLFRANYLKRHYGLAYSRFVTFFMYLTFLTVAVGGSIGLATLIVFYDLGAHGTKILATIFFTTVAGSMLLLFIPLPVPKGQAWFSTKLRSFLSDRRHISSDYGAILQATAFLMISFALTALRLGMVYRSLGLNIHPAGCLVLGAISFVVLFIGLTPGALGIRELVLSSGAVVLGIPFEAGILAAMVDRAAAMSYAFLVGGGCALWSWFKCPNDFRQNELCGQQVNQSCA